LTRFHAANRAAIDESRPQFAFAGIWRPWTGTRGAKSAPVEGEHLLYSILTCAANDLVRPIHAKAFVSASIFYLVRARTIGLGEDARLYVLYTMSRGTTAA
jgi:hypothetical protein